MFPSWAEMRLPVMAVLLVVLTAVGPALHLAYGGWALLAIFVICGGGALLAAQTEVEAANERVALAVILIGALAMRLVLLLGEPYLSTDIYRYIWDGRVQAAGINPYRYVPAAPELNALRDAAIFPNINRADYAVTIYPPVAQAIFFAITQVLGESVVAMKLGLIGFELLAVAALAGCLRRLGLPLVRVAAYAWHPLAVWEVAGSGHVDAAMCGLLALGLLVFVGGRTLLAGVTVTLAALVKPPALLALPAMWRPWDWRLPAVAVATVALAYVPYLSVGAGVLGYLPGYVDEEGLASGQGIGPVRLIEQITGPLPYATVAYALIATVILAGLAFAVAFRQDRSQRAAIAATAWLLVAFLILASPHYPWYFLVLVPFLALAPSATAWTLTLLCPLLYDSIANAGWPGYDARTLLLLLATFAALAWDARGLTAPRHKPTPSTTGELA